MKENGNKNGKISTRLKGVLIMLASAVLIAVDLVLTFIEFNHSGDYKKGRVLGLLLLCLLLCLLWGFYGFVLVIQGDKKGGKANEQKNVGDAPASVNSDNQKQEKEKEKTALPTDNKGKNDN